MSTVTVPQLPTDLPEEDGVPLESDWHRLAMTLLIELVGLHLQGRRDYFVAGNMFVYFDPNQDRSQNFRGPDFFFVAQARVTRRRKYWAIWEEGGKFPDVIVELSSPTTKGEDNGIKKDLYEKTFQTSEYFIYDPADDELKGWRLDSKQRYRPIQANDKGWLWSQQLGLFLGTWKGEYQFKEDVYLRFYDKDGNLIATQGEGRKRAEQRADNERQRADAAEVEKQRVEIEKQRERQRADVAEVEKLRAEAEKQQMESEKRQIETEKHQEKQRADSAEAELARLRAQLKKSED